jgi:hypothetical protein
VPIGEDKARLEARLAVNRRDQAAGREGLGAGRRADDEAIRDHVTVAIGDCADDERGRGWHDLVVDG